MNSLFLLSRLVMRIAFVFLVVVAVNLSSCSSNTQPAESVTDLLTKRTWRFDSATPDPAGFSQLFRGLTLQYNRNGQVTLNFPGVGTATGTWRLQNNDRQIVINYSDPIASALNDTYDILEITNSVIRVREQTPTMGVAVEYRYVPA
jgi:hypothetical protein